MLAVKAELDDVALTIVMLLAPLFLAVIVLVEADFKYTLSNARFLLTSTFDKKYLIEPLAVVAPDVPEMPTLTGDAR